MSKLKLQAIVFLSTLYFCNAAKAQQEFTLNGVVFESGTKIRIALVEINNKRNHYSVGSNDMGLFKIKAVVGDTLEIIKRGFNDVQVVVASTKDMVITLNRGNTLNEVVINGQNKKQSLDELKHDYVGKGSFYAGKPPLALLNPFGGSPLTFFYELFGKTPKRARRFNKLYKAELQQNEIDLLFNKSTINKNTGLEGKELENFMVNYRPDYQKAKNWTVYDATKWIKDSYKKYTDTLKKP